MSTGYSAIRTPSVNKGLAFTSKERDELKLRGLLPIGETSIELETKRALLQLRKKSSPLEKYIFMQSMQDTNEAVYYRLLVENTAELMPIVYTPTVGQACLEFSHIYRQTPRGLYISIKDVGRVAELLDAWPEKDIRAIVFTDGERILGLGDLGVNGMGIPVGKLALYTACAGVPPHMCLPVVLDCGTNNTEFLEDELYMGIRQKREQGPLFEQLVDEFMNAAKEKYGPQVLLQFEDFGNSTAFHLLRKYENTHCTFNDDIQGTASVVLAGLLAAVPLSGKALSKHTFVFMGAGEAGTGIADLIARAISHETGKSIEKARQQIWLVDSRGLVVASRKESLQHHKLLYAHEAPECKTLEEAIDRIKPSALIGVCTIPKTFSKEVCEKMTALNERHLDKPCEQLLAATNVALFCGAGPSLATEIISDAIRLIKSVHDLTKTIEKGELAKVPQLTGRVWEYSTPRVSKSNCVASKRSMLQCITMLNSTVDELNEFLSEQEEGTALDEVEQDDEFGFDSNLTEEERTLFQSGLKLLSMCAAIMKRGVLTIKKLTITNDQDTFLKWTARLDISYTAAQDAIVDFGAALYPPIGTDELSEAVSELETSATAILACLKEMPELASAEENALGVGEAAFTKQLAIVKTQIEASS